MKYILINGKKRSGKDYFARALKKELEALGHKSHITAFADPIKDILSITFNIPKDYLDELKNVEEPIGRCREKMGGVDYEQFTNMRLILQNFGTDAMKKWFGENVWSDLLVHHTKDLDVDYVLVPDFRFLSENIDNSITVKVEGDGLVDDNHLSENELNDFEFMYKINNTGKPDLTKQVQDFIKFVMKYEVELDTGTIL